MKRHFPCLAALVAGMALADPAPQKTKVAFFFDTEDYTCDRSNDSIREIANILTEEGAVGHFNIVGYCCRQLVHFRRWDVLDALKPLMRGSA